LATYPRRPSYGIFVKFRRSRLALRRGIVHLEDALALAEQLRASRFHDRGDIFVVKEPEGTLIEVPPPALPSVPPVTVAPAHPETPQSRWELRPAVTMGALPPKPRPAPSQPVPVDEAKPAPPTPQALGAVAEARPPVEIPPPARRSALPRASSAHELADLLRLIAQANDVRGTVDRARVAQARFERACQAMDHASQRHDAPPAVDLRHNQERLLALRTSSARSVASFERVAIVVERRLAVAWAEATGRPAPGR
jgi:hypothetical protein